MNDSTVIVESHAILSDTISVQICLQHPPPSWNTTTTTTTTTSPEQCDHDLRNTPLSEPYHMYTSHDPPPLHTWYDKNHVHNDDIPLSRQLPLEEPIPPPPNPSIQQDTNELEGNMDSTGGRIDSNQQQTPQKPHSNHYWRKEQNWPPYPYGVVIVDRICGEAILRGADIYPTTGILCTDTYIVPHTPVAVYVDMTNTNHSNDMNNTTQPHKTKKVSRGMTLQEYSTSTVDHRTVLFIGIGIATCTRSEIFTKNIRVPTTQHTTTSTTAAIHIIQRSTPTMSNVLPPTNEIFSNYDDIIVVQNLPSLLVAHTLLDDIMTLDRTGSNNIGNDVEWILDMCCAPGGKTSHLASLLSRQGRTKHSHTTPGTQCRRPITRIIACDKSQSKILQVRDTFKKLHCDDIITPIVLDTTKCVLPSIEVHNSNETTLSKVC